MNVLKLEDLAKIKLVKDIEKKPNEGLIEIKRLGFNLKIRELDDYDMYDAMEEANKANDLDSSINANAFMLLKGVIEPNFKDIEVQKALGEIDPIKAIKSLLTAREIGEIALKIRDLGEKENSIGDLDRIKGL